MHLAPRNSPTTGAYVHGVAFSSRWEVRRYVGTMYGVVPVAGVALFTSRAALIAALAARGRTVADNGEVSA